VKIPRNESGLSLTKKLKKLGYSVKKQTGSHIQLTNGEHNITVPAHKNVKIGTLNSILVDLAQQLNITKEELIKRLW